MTEIWKYTGPVYARVLLFAFMHRVEWANHRALDPEVAARENLRAIDLGRRTGKTTAICEFAKSNDGCLIVCQTMEFASRIQRRTGMRAFGVDELKRLKRDHFSTTDPMFIFDDVSLRQTLETVAQFKPSRFCHVGAV